jgi:pimeloyl-ACP methyl ester carboxylesterase
LKQKTIKSLFLRKLPGNKIFFFSLLLILDFSLSAFSVIRKETVTFESADGLTLTADEYIIAKDHPYILLFHKQGSSRGAFLTIARRLCKMDYNCLAVDLRNGGNDQFVSNETVKRCRESRCHTGYEQVENDILAAIRYAYERSGQPVILFGSMANGSLCMKIARENDNVRAVVAFSPGEYFLPLLSIQDTIAGMKKPTFVTSSLSESPYMTELVSGIEADYVTVFQPELGEGGRGLESLANDNPNHSEYWLALLLFFKDLV